MQRVLRPGIGKRPFKPQNARQQPSQAETPRNWRFARIPALRCRIGQLGEMRLWGRGARADRFGAYYSTQ